MSTLSLRRFLHCRLQTPSVCSSLPRGCLPSLSQCEVVSRVYTSVETNVCSRRGALLPMIKHGSTPPNPTPLAIPLPSLARLLSLVAALCCLGRESPRDGLNI